MMMPLIAGADDVPAAVRYAQSNPRARWYTANRAEAFGEAWQIPAEWFPGRNVAASSFTVPGKDVTAMTAPTTTTTPTDGPSIDDQIAGITDLSDAELSALAERVMQAFQDADAADDLDGMADGADQNDSVNAEIDRRKTAPKAKPATAEPATTGKPAGMVAAAAATKQRPVQVTQTIYAPAPPAAVPARYSQPSPLTAEQAAALQARIAENDRLNAELERQRMDCVRAGVTVALGAEFLPPMRWLLDACAANATAPAWAISVWINALVGPGRVYAPDPTTTNRLNFATAEPLRMHLDDWRAAWVLTEALCAGRHNEMPNPAIIARTPHKSPECSWIAVAPSSAPGDPLDALGLLAAVQALATGPDPSAAVDKYRLQGDVPTTKLAALLAGPVRDEQVTAPGFPERDPSDAYRDFAVYGHAGTTGRQIHAQLIRPQMVEPLAARLRA